MKKLQQSGNNSTLNVGQLNVNRRVQVIKSYKDKMTDHAICIYERIKPNTLN